MRSAEPVRQLGAQQRLGAGRGRDARHRANESRPSSAAIRAHAGRRGAAVAGDEHRRQRPPRARPATSASGESPACQASSRPRRRRARARGAKIAGSGLAAPSSADATAPSTQRREPGLGEPLVQRDVPVGDDHEPDAAARAARAARRAPPGRRGSAARPAAPRSAPRRRRRRGLGQRRPHRLARAARRSAASAGGVAALVQVRAVVGDLRADRRAPPPPRRRRRPSRARSAARRCGAGGSNVSRVPIASSRRLGSRLRAAMAASACWTGGRRTRRSARSVIFAFFVLLAFVFDRVVRRRAGASSPSRVLRGGITQQTDTRLRFVRRLVSLVLLVFGVARRALAVRRASGEVAGSFLASGALVAAIVGFAARQTLANLVAGIMLTITQPLRVGDWVTFEDNYGVVEDVRLNFTILRTLLRAADRDPQRAAGQRDPAQRHARDRARSGWTSRSGCPPGADVPRALDVLREETGQSREHRRERAPRARGWRSAASACHRPNAPSTRRSCASSACARLRADGPARRA